MIIYTKFDQNQMKTVVFSEKLATNDKQTNKWRRMKCDW